MACNINYDEISSITIDCEAAVGGIKTLAIANWAAIRPADSAFKEINFNNQDKTTNYTEALENGDDGSTVVTQTLTVFFSGFNADTRTTLNELCNPNIKAIIKVTLANDTVVYMGERFGAVLTKVESSSGSATRDTQGYTATWTAEEATHGTVVAGDTGTPLSL